MANKYHEIMFTPGVKTAQEHHGSRQHYAKFETGETKFAGLSEFEEEFIIGRDGFYLATVSENDYPYIQFRGGARGFLKVLDAKTLGYADFRGNLQYRTCLQLKNNDMFGFQKLK